jgi:2-succinyl-6-hydroxy-2,4-cyclohexadiene-1-carboxylate synthase
MSHIKVHDVFYNIQRSGTGEPVVLLHGFTGNTETWTEQTPFFDTRFSTLSIDLPGHGESEAPADPARYGIDCTARDLIAIFDWLLLEKVHLVGYSMGGRVALYLAAHYPQRIKSLVLESTSPGIADSAQRSARAESDHRLADWMEDNGLAAFVDRWEQLPLFITQKHLPVEVRGRLRSQRMQNNITGLANSLRGLSTGVQPSGWDELPYLDVPTLIVAGKLDYKFVNIARQMNRLLPDSKLVILPRAGHTTHLEQPSAFNQLVLKYLMRVEQKTGQIVQSA